MDSFLDSDDYFTTEPFNYFDWIIASHINCKVFYFSSKADKAISMDLFRQDVVLATLGTRGIKMNLRNCANFLLFGVDYIIRTILKLME